MSPSLPLAFRPDLPRGPLSASGGPSLTLPKRTTPCVHRDIRFSAVPIYYHSPQRVSTLSAGGPLLLFASMSARTGGLDVPSLKPDDRYDMIVP